MVDTREILDFSKRVAREAGAIAMEGFRSRDLGIDLKKDFHDMVTEYDRAAEVHVRRAILEEFPDSAIVGEEGGASEGSGGLTWYVDPIDGTANFARGTALWAVSIGVAVDGEVVVGVVYDPANDQLFSADGRGAFLDDEPMLSWGYSEPARATVVSEFPSPRDLERSPVLALEQFGDLTREFAHVRNIGSAAVSLCWVAAGWVDATIAFEVNSWDVAAAAFIVQQAGGTYHAYLAGEVQSGARIYEHPHYYAAAPGAEFEILHEILRVHSRRPTAASH